MRVQPMGQAQQLSFLTRYFSVSVSPEMSSACFELGLAVVAGGQRADGVDDVHHHHRAELGQRLAGERAGA